MQGRILLRLAVGALTVMALIWFILSFFVLEDENPRSSRNGPSHELAEPPAPMSA